MGDSDSFSGIIQHFASKAPHAPALFTAKHEEISYESLARALRHGGQALADLGISQGACVALVMENGPEMAIMLPLLLDVACCAPLNPAYAKDEFLFYLRDLPADVLLVAAKGNPAAEEAAARLEIPVIRLARRAGGDDWRLAFNAPGGPPAPAQSPGPDGKLKAAPSLLLHTSGTTSRPKLVPHSLSAILSSAMSIAASMSLSSLDRCLCLSPLFHVKGMIGAWLASLTSGASLVLPGRFEPQTALRLLTQCKATWCTAAPFIHQAMLAELKETNGFTHDLRFIRSCSAKMPVSLLTDLEAAFGVPCLEAYGLTEACSNLASNPLPPGLRKPGSAGLPINCEIRIMASDGAVLPPCAVGEVCISGDRVMKGYKNNPEANRAAYFGPWLRTGDQGWLDEDGYLFITGRLKELINKGGQKIAPGEVEEELLRHPDVDQAAVYAMPHPSLGEDVAACVVPRRGASPDPYELRFFVAERLAAFKVPSQIVVVSEIPKGPTGKVSRIGLYEKIKAMPVAVFAKKQFEDAAGLGMEILDERLQRMLDLWRELFGAQYGLEDDFFESGGHSLLSIRLMARVEEEFGVRIPGTFLYQYGTPAALYDYAKKQLVENSPRSLQRDIEVVTVKEGSGGDPLFLLHDVNGRVLWFHSLNAHLDYDGPIYGLCRHNDDEGSVEVEDIAARHAEKITAFYPRGKILLLGYSIGGVYAYETARQLKAAGRRVELVILDIIKEYRPYLFPVRIFGHMIHLVKLPRGERGVYLRQRLRNMKAKVAPFFKNLSFAAAKRVEARREEAQPVDSDPRKRQILEARARYRFSSYSGRIFLLQTEQPKLPFHYVKDFYCGKLKPEGGLITYTINGTHISCVQEEFAEHNAGVLRNCLRRIRRS